FGDSSACRRCRAVVPYGAECPPSIKPYPEVPTRPVRLLLIGWNPPRRGGGFWSLDGPDNLRDNLRSIFRRLGLTDTQTPQTFLEDFLTRGFFFIHAIKCFSRATLPGSAAARRELLRVCVEAHLADDLARLQPER